MANKLVTINARKDFIRLQKKGIKVVNKGFFLIFCRNGLTYRRFAWAFAFRNKKKPVKAKAVWRNRLKRWAREFMKQRQDLCPPGMDILLGLDPKQSFNQRIKYEEFCSCLEKICKKIKH